MKRKKRKPSKPKTVVEKYSGLIDIVVEALVREIESGKIQPVKKRKRRGA